MCSASTMWRMDGILTYQCKVMKLDHGHAIKLISTNMLQYQ